MNNNLPIVSHHCADLLKSAEESVSLLDHALFELNVTGNKLQDSVGIINHNLDHARDNSAAAKILSSMSGALQTRASHQLKVGNNTHQSALHTLSEVSCIKERVSRLNGTLEEANRIIREGEVQHAHTTEIKEVYTQGNAPNTNATNKASSISKHYLRIVFIKGCPQNKGL